MQSAAFEAARSSTRGSAGRPVAPRPSSGMHAAGSHQARPKAGTLTMPRRSVPSAAEVTESLPVHVKSERSSKWPAPR